jgi:hypothetical protein
VCANSVFSVFDQTMNQLLVWLTQLLYAWFKTKNCISVRLLCNNFLSTMHVSEKQIHSHSRYITTLFILGVSIGLHVLIYPAKLIKYPSMGYWKWSIIYSCMWKLDRTILVEVSLTKIGSLHFGIYIVICLLHTAIGGPYVMLCSVVVVCLVTNIVILAFSLCSQLRSN